MKLIEEIKRRKVFQATALYAVVAWLIAQVVSVIDEPLGLPAWFDTAAIVLLAIGFPIVIVMSWAFSFTGAGLIRERASGGSQADEAAARAAATGPIAPSAAPPPRILDKPSIAVLPFQTLGGDADQDYLADGLVESITTGLSLVRSFFVISRNSAFTFKNRVANAIDIGRELGVGYLLEGSVQRAGERIRITAQLIETGTGAHIWAKHYDGTTQDLFDLQDRITESVVGALQPSIRLAEIERSGRKRPQEQGAYDLTMRAMRHVWSLEKEECHKALDLLDRALAIEPSYPLALSLAGWCHAQRAVYNWSADIAKSRAKAQEFAERAAELSSDDPLVQTVLGTVYTIVRKFGTARSLLERAVALDPNASWAWQRLGWLKTYQGDLDEALEHFQRALRLSPVDPMNFNVRAGMGSAHEVAQRYGEAVREYQRALEERPNAYWIYRHLASALVGAGRMAEAKQAYATMMSRFPEMTVNRVREALLYPEPTLTRMTDNLKVLGLP
jgi:adenylate cyclase